MPAVVRWWAGAALLLAALLFGRPAAAMEAQPVAYSEFIQDVQARRVAYARITGQRLEAAYRDGTVRVVTLP
ncbi:ATP-dependent metallopeptidase FtsH/Yme1/Tma family protein, partial [Symbiobacterium thermophilum]